jgi:cytochrome c5
MWLGVAFLALCVIAVVLQAWLWNPKYWDPIAKKSHAPPFWMGVHRVVGYAYAALYVVMMYFMVPRLWEYQVELPARTVIHAVAAITIGVVLFSKIIILRFFRHFEEAMPMLGMVLLVCTVVLGALSLPFAFRAHGSSEVLAQENRERVERIFEQLELGGDFTAAGLSSVSSLERGREVVVRECTLCHDLRTILSEPRTGSGWLNLCRRMQDKPTFGQPMSDESIHFAAAYLIAITPNLRDDAQRRRDEEEERDAVVEELTLEPILLAAAEPPPEEAPPELADAGVLPTDAGVAPLTEEPSAAVATAASSRSKARSRRLRARRLARARARSSGATTSSTAIANTTPNAPSTTAAASASHETTPTTAAAPARPTYSAALAQQLLRRACTDCHGLSDIDEHGGDDRAGWAAVVRRMIQEGAELTTDEARILVTYLAARYPVAP